MNDIDFRCDYVFIPYITSFMELYNDNVLFKNPEIFRLIINDKFFIDNVIMLAIKFCQYDYLDYLYNLYQKEFVVDYLVHIKHLFVLKYFVFNITLDEFYLFCEKYKYKNKLILKLYDNLKELDIYSDEILYL